MSRCDLIRKQFEREKSGVAALLFVRSLTTVELGGQWREISSPHTLTGDRRKRREI